MGKGRIIICVDSVNNKDSKPLFEREEFVFVKLDNSGAQINRKRFWAVVFFEKSTNWDGLRRNRWGVGQIVFINFELMRATTIIIGSKTKW
jgi:hypothetical protein